MSWQDKIRNPDCELCSLHESAEYVCLMGQGPRKAKIMIVGEAPGEREDEAHVAFVGPSGQLLRRALRKEASIEPDECYITNVVKCRPPENRTPTRTEAKICAGAYLTAELERVRPDFILGVGNAPLQALLRTSGITKRRGSPVQLGESTFLPTFHPAYVLRSPQHEPVFRADLQRFGRLVRGEAAPGARTRVKLIRTVSQLRWLKKQIEEAKLLSIDFETSSNGLTGKKHRYHKPWDPDGKIIMMGVSWEEGLGIAVPLHHAQSPWKDPDAVLRFLKPALEQSRKLIGHNSKFDAVWAAAKGVFLRFTFDTMLAAHILDENRSKGLKPLSQILLGVDAYDVGEELKDAYNMDLRRLAIYQGKDVDYPIRLYYIFRQQLIDQPRLRKVFTKLMMPASNELVKVETVGIWVDGRNLKIQQQAATEIRDEIEAEMRKYVPKKKRETLNFRSPQQVAGWLFGDLGLDIVKETKSGGASTDEDTLMVLADQHPAAKLLMRYRTFETKYLRTYLNAWEAGRDRKSRVHTHYKLYGTVTGRLSSEHPNLQQVPRESSMRSCFGAPPGWTFVEADYSQIELRIAAMLSGDRTLLRIFREGGDPHLATAVAISGLSEKKILKLEGTTAKDGTRIEHRKKAKPVNFGYLYGMGEEKFITYAKTNYGMDVTPEEAHRSRTTYFNLYSDLPRWHERQRRLVRSLGRVHSPLGRVRHLPDVHSRDKKVRGEAERQAINSPVQSMASDLMLLSLVRLSHRLDPRLARIVGTVHDSILFEVHRDYVDKASEMIKETMEDVAFVEKTFDCEITVPIEVELKVSQHWGEK